MTIREILDKATAQLTKQNISSALLDAEILLAHSLSKQKEFLYTHPDYRPSESTVTRFNIFLQRRLNREPIAYLINKKELYSYDFYVDKRVLIPRPETEKLVDAVKTQISKLKSQNHNLKLKPNNNLHLKQYFLVIDIGTGSGCIIISLVKELLKSSQIQKISHLTFIATDISADALTVAKINARQQGVNNYIKFYQGDLLEPLLTGSGKALPHPGKTIIITANLPYITPTQYKNLQPEIKKYEPPLALLTPNNDADYYYEKLNRQLIKWRLPKNVKVYKFYEQPFSILYPST